MTPHKRFNTLSDIIPDLARKYRTLKPTELASAILSDFNVQTTPQSVTMFFKRHTEIEQQLQKELVNEGKAEVEVSEGLFENVTFKELNSIKKWVIEMTPRLSPNKLLEHVNCVKNVCMGAYWMREQVNEKNRLVRYTIENWNFKHPDRLTIEQTKEYIAHLHKLGHTTGSYRISLRSFFLSRDEKEVKTTDISGDKGKLGKWSRVFVPRETIYQILNYVKERNFEAYVIDFFNYKTGTRIEATLNEVKKSNIHYDGGVHTITILDKGLHRHGRQTWEKLIPENLYVELFKLFQQNGEQAFPNVSYTTICELNKEAYNVFLKDNPEALELALHEPNHFWRHMAAQHTLRALNWNYDLVAELLGWTDTATLKACYGKPPREILRKAGLDVIPNI
jgi:integrase